MKTKTFHIFTYVATVLFLLSITSVAFSNENKTVVDRYRMALSIDSDNPTLRYYLGIALMLSGDDSNAINEMRRAYPSYADSAEMNYNLGIAYSRTGDADNAVIYLEQAESLGATKTPELYPLANAYYNLSLLYLEEKNYSDAELMARKLLEIDPSRAEAYYLIGEISDRANKQSEAVKSFISYLEFYPEDTDIKDYLYTYYHNAGADSLDQEDLVAARSHFSSARKFGNDLLMIDYFLGYIDYLENKLPEAISLLGKIYPFTENEIKENCRSLLFNIALTLLETGDPVQMRESLNATAPLTSILSPNPDDIFLSGNIHLKLKEFLKAKELYNRVLNIDPGHRGAILNLIAAQKGSVKETIALGQGFYRKGEYRQALDAFQQAYDLDQADPYANAYLKDTTQKIKEEITLILEESSSLYRKNLFSEALVKIHRVLYLNPDHKKAKLLEKNILKAFTDEIESLLGKSEQLIEQERYTEALKPLNDILTMAPSHTGALLKKSLAIEKLEAYVSTVIANGNILIEQNKPTEALTTFSEALNLSPNNIEAKEGHEKALALKTARFIAELKFARLAKGSGNYKKSKTHYLSALSYNDDPDIRNEMNEMDTDLTDRAAALIATAEGLAQQESWKKARDVYQQVLNLDTNNLKALNGYANIDKEISRLIGRLLTEADNKLQKSPAVAIKLYRRILDLEPGSGAALNGLQRGKSLISNEIKQMLTEGNIGIEASKYAVATSAFNRVLDIDPYNKQAKAGLKRIKKAKVVGLKAGDVNKLYLEGIGLYTSGKYLDAIDLWEKVLIINPKHVKASMNMEKAKRKMKQLKERTNG